MSSPNRIHSLLLSYAVALTLAACGTYSQQGAEQGAKAGFIGGAVAGAVGSIFWGGNALENAIIGGVVSAAGGAAIGAAAGNEVDKAVASQQALAQRDQAIEAKIGADNFEAARDLARCKHSGAIKKAREAYGEAPSDELRTYALAIEAIAAEESGDTETAAAVYPKLSALMPSHASPEKLRGDALAAILKVQKVRTDHGAPPICG